MILKFWGVRGSIPTPGEKTVHFGGNTSCISVQLGNNLVIFDAGTGVRALGLWVLDMPTKPRIDMFLSHVHWDHIQGFPFFGPGYVSGYEINVYGKGKADTTLGQILAGQMEGPNFPVSLGQLEASFTYRDLHQSSSGTIEILDSASQVVGLISCAQGNHPNGVILYRLTDPTSGASIVYATDTEHYPDRMDSELARLAENADILIYDGMFTPEDYESKYKGWGHSTWEKGFEIASHAKVKKLVIFHHDPNHEDGFLLQYEREIQEACRKRASPLEIVLAREEMEIAV